MQVQRPWEAVTPTLDGDVLAVLANADSGFTVSQLVRLIDASDEGLRRVARRLAAQGIVTATSHGRLTTYSLNRDHVLAEAVVSMVSAKQCLLDRIAAAVSAWAGAPVYAAVYGSAARGEMSVNSDIDLFLVRPEGVDGQLWDQQVDELSDQVARWTGNDAQAVSFDEADVRAGDEFLANVLNEGLTVCGSPRWLRQRLTA